MSDKKDETRKLTDSRVSEKHFSVNKIVANHNMKCQAICRADGKVIGQLDGLTMKKVLYASQHMLRKPPAWAMDVDILDLLEREGCKWVEIKDRESELKYRAGLPAFRLYGLEFDRGFGQQCALPLKYWAITRPDDLDAVQLELF